MEKSAREQVPGGRSLFYLDMLILTHVKMEMSPNGDGICGGEHNVEAEGGGGAGDIKGVEGVDWARRDWVVEEVLMGLVQVSGGVPPLTRPNYHLAGFIILIYTPSGNGSVPRFLSLFSVLFLRPCALTRSRTLCLVIWNGSISDN